MLTTKNAARKLMWLLLLSAVGLTGCRPPGALAFLRGKSLMERGRYTEAVDELKTATVLLATNAQAAQAWNYLGLACHYSGRVTNAVQAYQKAIALDHDLVEAHYNLGCLWLEQSRPDLARSELTTYTSLHRNAADGWVKLGSAELRAAKFAAGPARATGLAEAEKCFTEAIRIDSRSAEAWNGLGLVQLQHNHPHEAAQEFSRALQERPDYGPAMLNLAVVSEVYLNNRPFALQKYRDYLGLAVPYPNVEAVTNAVRELAQSLNPESARQVATVAPPSAAAPAVAKPVSTSSQAAQPVPRPVLQTNSMRVATAPVQPPRPTEAAAAPTARPTASGTGVSASTAPAVATTVAANSARTNTTPDKSGFFSRLWRRSPKTNAPPSNVRPVAPATVAGPPVRGLEHTPRYHYRSPATPQPGDQAGAKRAFAKGLQAQETGRLADAVSAYRQATGLDPADFEAYYNLALASAQQGDLPQALLAYEYALALKPDSADSRYNFALVLKRANYLADAINELGRILALNPAESRAHLALGNIYAQQLHEPAVARAHYEKLLETDPHNSQADAIRYWLKDNPP